MTSMGKSKYGRPVECDLELFSALVSCTLSICTDVSAICITIRVLTIVRVFIGSHRYHRYTCTLWIYHLVVRLLHPADTPCRSRIRIHRVQPARYSVSPQPRVQLRRCWGPTPTLGPGPISRERVRSLLESQGLRNDDPPTATEFPKTGLARLVYVSLFANGRCHPCARRRNDGIAWENRMVASGN